MWQYHDSKMIELRKIYNKISKRTQNKLQEIFKVLNLNYENLYQIATKKTRNFINVKYDEWKDKKLLKGYFGTLASNINKRIRVQNNEILELLIYSAFIEEQNTLEYYERDIIYDDLNYYYKEGQKEVNTTLKDDKEILDLSDILFLSLLALNLNGGYTFEQYKQTSLKNTSDNIYRQAVLNIQHQKELDIFDVEFQKIVNNQLNSKIKINIDKDNNNTKIHGAIDNQLIELLNIAKMEGIVTLDKEAKVKFIAVEDDVTTKMCHSLNNQIFNVRDWNVFYRYSETNRKITKYNCYGLISGLNLPPIDDHFHWCRSTITYVAKNIVEYEAKERLFKKSIISYNINGISKLALLQNIKNANSVEKDFPILKNKIGRIIITKGKDYLMAVRPKIDDCTLCINSSEFYSVENLERIYNEMVKAGDAPKNSTYKDIFIHELGHAVLNEYIKKKYKNDYIKCVEDWNMDITADDIINRAYEGVNVQFNKNSTIAKISRYAQKNNNEAIAEAFVDYYVNKEKCQKISKNIIKILKEGL